MSNLGLGLLMTLDTARLKRGLAEAEREVQRSSQKQADAIGKVEKAADDVGKTYVDSAGRMRDANGRFVASAKSAEGAIAGMGKSAQKAKASMADLAVASGAVFAGLAMPVAVAVKRFADFESAMNRVGAVSGATGSEFESLKKQALDLGATTQYSATQAADAMGFLAMAGFKTTQILGAMPGVLQLAAAAQMEIADAADIASNILTGYNKKTEELAHLNDVLVKTMTATNTDLRQLGEAMKYAGPVAASAGVSFEQAAAAVGLLGNAGIQASMAGTSLRGIISRLLNPTGEAQKVLDRLGISAVTSGGKLRSLVDIVAQLEKSGATTADMMEVFGDRAGPAMAALISQGSQALGKLSAELLTVDGLAEKIAKQQIAGIKGALVQLDSAVDGLAVAFGEGLAPAVSDTALGLADAASGLSKMPPEIRMVVTALTGATVTFTGVYTALGLIGTGAKIASGGIAAMGLTVRSVMPLVGLLSLAVAGFVAMEDQAARADAEAAKRLADERQKRLDTANAAKQQKEKLAALVKEHDELASKASLSKKEQERLNQIQETLKKEYPQLAEAIKKAGDKHWKNVEAIQAETKALDELMRKQEQQAKMAVTAAQADLEKQRAEWQAAAAAATTAANDATGMIDAGLNGPGLGGGIAAGAANRAAGAKLTAEVQFKVVGAAADKLKAAQDHLKALQDALKPTPAPKKKTDDNDDGDGGHTGGETPGEKAAREASEFEKALAEERTKQAEAEAERLTTIEKGRIERRLALLKYEHEAGKSTNEEYLRDVEKIRTQEIAVQMAATTAKLKASKTATESELAEAERSGQGKAKEAEVLRAKLTTIGKQLQAADTVGQQALLSLHQDTDQQIAEGKRKAAKELTDIERKSAAESKAIAKETALEHLNYFDRQVEQARLYYEGQREAEQEAYRQQIEHIAELEREGVDGTGARKAALATLGAKLVAIAADEQKAAAQVKYAWVSALHDIGGELSDLVKEPSWDKLANFSLGFLEDPSKIDQWTGAFAKATQQAERFGGAMNWLTGAEIPS